MPLFPKIEKDRIIDGSLINLLNYCKKHFDSMKCRQYYEQLKSASPGLYTCPLGLSSYVYELDTQKIIFTGFRLKNTYEKEKAKFFKDDRDSYNPIMANEQAQRILNDEIQLLEAINHLDNEKALIKDLLHETRKMNGEIKNICDSIWEHGLFCPITNEQCEQSSILQVLDQIRQIHTFSYMTYSRFSFYDMIVNPSLQLQNKNFYTATIYKKFDKMRKILKNYEKKNISIYLNNNSTFSYYINPTFEVLLFLLLENAIKYSPIGKSVNISFYEVKNTLTVEIKSIGPFCKPDELEKLCTKGFRGDNARSSGKNGNGLGLCFATQICELLKIRMSFKSLYNYEKIDDIPYGDFIINLFFSKRS